MIGTKSFITLFSVVNKRRLQAIWAQVVIAAVCNNRSAQTNVPLLDHIRKLNLPDHTIQYLKEKNIYDQKQLKKERDEFMSAFDVFNGVILPQQLLQAQVRFLLARNKQNKVTFYPNNTVTSQIFNILVKNFTNSMQSKNIIVGKPGISKSMSFIFYWHLSTLISKFCYDNPKEAKQMIQKNIFKKKIFKLLYVNFNFESTDQKEFIQLILAQCPQLTQQQLQELIKQAQIKDIQYILRHIRHIYKKKQINCFIIVDQINALARIFKQYNYQKKLSLKNSKLANENTINKLNEEADTLNLLHKTIRRSIPRIYNSSSNIELQLLGKPNYMSHLYYTLQLTYHTQPTIINIKYNQNMTQSQIKQIYRFIWYQFVKKLDLTKNQVQEKAKGIEQHFINCCDNLVTIFGFSSFITPLSIAKSFHKLDIIQLQSLLEKMGNFSVGDKNNFDISQIKLFVQNMCQIIIQAGLKNLQQKTIGFLSDLNQSDRLNKFKLLFSCILYFNQNPIQNKIPFIHIANNSGITDIKNIQKFCDNDIFSVQNESLSLRITQQQFQKLSKKWFLKFVQNPSNSTQIVKFCQKNPITRGYFIEQTISQLLFINTPAGLFLSNSMYFQCQKILTFPHLLNKNADLIKNISKLFQKIQQDKVMEVYYFGRPKLPKLSASLENSKQKSPQQKNQNQLQQHTIQLQSHQQSINNPVFDLIAIKKNKKQQYQVQTIDFSVAKNKSTIKNKLQKANLLLQDLNKNQKVVIKVKPENKNNLVQKIKKIQNYQIIQSNRSYSTQFAHKVLSIIDNQQLFKKYIQFSRISKKNYGDTSRQIRDKIKQKLSIKDFKVIQDITFQLLEFHKLIQFVTQRQINIKSWQHIIIRPINKYNQVLKSSDIPISWVSKCGTSVSFQVAQKSQVDLRLSSNRMLDYNSLQMLNTLNLVWRIDS